MKYTLKIQQPNERTSALLNLIRSYDEIILEEELEQANKIELSKKQKSILDERLKEHKEDIDNSFSWEDAKKQIRTNK